MKATIQVGSGFVEYEPRPQEVIQRGDTDGQQQAAEGSTSEVEAGAPE